MFVQTRPRNACPIPPYRDLFLRLYGPACSSGDVKQIPEEVRRSADHIWFVRRPKESHYGTLINDSVSQPVNDDEWVHYHQIISMLGSVCLGLLRFDTGSRCARKGLRRRPQAKTNDRDRLC